MKRCVSDFATDHIDMYTSMTCPYRIKSLLNIMLVGFPAILDRLNSDNEIFVKFSRKQ